MEKSGYNLFKLMNSFMGYTGQILLLITHKDKVENNPDAQTIYLGMLLHGNIKECYEEPAGDDFSNFFYLSPNLPLTIFKTKQNTSSKPSYVYISSKNLQYSKKTPGIGMGATIFDDYRFWLDNNV